MNINLKSQDCWFTFSFRLVKKFKKIKLIYTLSIKKIKYISNNNLKSYYPLNCKTIQTKYTMCFSNYIRKILTVLKKKKKKRLLHVRSSHGQNLCSGNYTTDTAAHQIFFALFGEESFRCS